MNEPRRSLRLALIEIYHNETPPSTPMKTSPDEMVIIQRGPRRKPVTWSPLDFDKDHTPTTTEEESFEEEAPKNRLSSKIRRRLIMSPSKNNSSNLGEVLSKKLKTLPSLKF